MLLRVIEEWVSPSSFLNVALTSISLHAAVYVNSLLGSLNARAKMHGTSSNKALPANAEGTGNNSSGTDSNAYTSGSSSAASGGILTTAIVLGTMDIGSDGEGHANIRAFEEEREKSKHSTPRSGYTRLEEV